MPTRRSFIALMLVTGMIAGCGAAASTAAPPSSAVLPSGDLPKLGDGTSGPGTFVLMPPAAGWGECTMAAPDCPPEPPHARTLRLEITVPAGWVALEGFEGSVIAPEGDGSTEGPAGAGSVIGWSNRAGLHSDPCLPISHKTPDIPVGPTVDDFVDAVVAHPLLDLNQPVDTELGGYQGRFLTLTAPSDISGCNNWRPWEPGIYAQGPGNVWNLWIIDVDGLRMIILANEFPGTSAESKAALRRMIESIRFIP